MEFGLFLATIDFDAVRDSARLAEELGYHLLVFPDHFVHEGPSGYDPHTIAHDPILLTKQVQGFDGLLSQTDDALGREHGIVLN